MHDNTPAASGMRRIASWASIPALAVFAGALAWLRLDAITRGTLWAEDARIFLSGALYPSSWLQVVEPYAGYLQVVPRAAAALVVAIAPISQYAVAMTLVMCATTGTVAALVFALTRDLGLSRAARLALALITVAAPGILNEILGNGANIHSILLWLAPFLLLYRPRTCLGSAALAIVTLLVFTSEIQAVVFLPLLLWRGRHRTKLPIVGAAALGTALEVWALFTSERASTAEVHPLALVYGFALQAGGSEWVSRTIELGRVIAQNGWLVAFALLVPATAAAVFLVMRSRRDRVLVVAFAAASVIIFAAGVIVNWDSPFDYPDYTAAQLRAVSTVRYGAVPSMLMLAVLVIAADRLLRGRPNGARLAARTFGALIVVAVLASAVTNFAATGHTLRAHGPLWSEQVAAAAASCRTGTFVPLDAAPNTSWQLLVSCEDLRADHA